MTLILTIETTCDETAAAVVDESLNVLGSCVASQDAVHQRFGGVVPEIAGRAHLENILPVIHETIKRAECAAGHNIRIDAVAVANMPGLAGSLLVGLIAAKTLAQVLNKPLIAVNHLQAHIYACKVAYKTDVFPCLGLIVSGGHTSFYRCISPLDFTFLGGTIDDAAGEAFDKVAAMLGLPYPGGPSIQKYAEAGHPKAYRFPRPLLNEPERAAFSFSGLKTAVLRTIEKTAAPLSAHQIADIAASFQESAVDCLVGKTLQILQREKMTTLCVGGGVAANKRFREKLKSSTAQYPVSLFIAPPQLCTDNAVMGAIALERYNAGLFEDLDLDISAGLIR